MNNFFDSSFEITATCASGIETLLKREVFRLGYGDAPAINGAVTFSGNKEAVARCNVFLRTADRVYINLKRFTALTFDELFEQTYSVPWEDIIDKDGRVVVDGKCVKSTLFAISACQSIVKKAIAQRLCKAYGLNKLSEDGATYRVDFAIFKDEASLLLNTSGAGLHKRGYRDMVGIAPLKETLAAALVMFSNMHPNFPFADVCCGSGTIVIEAARLALNKATLSRKFDFNDWECFDKAVFEKTRQEALDIEKKDLKLKFFGSDIDPKAVKLSCHHAERAGVNGYINFSRADVKDFTSSDKGGVIVTNPPYGDRVYGISEALKVYRSLGKAFSALNDWSAFVITSYKDFEKAFGVRADKTRKLFNAEKECRYYQFFGKKQ